MTDDEKERIVDIAKSMYDSFRWVLPPGPLELVFYLEHEILTFRRGYDQDIYLIMKTRKTAKFRSTVTITTNNVSYHSRYEDDGERLILRWERAEHAFKRRLGLLSLADETAN